MPSGWRSSEPMPEPSISGKAPNSAATVVIRMGRKRSSAAWWMASVGDLPSLRSASSAKSIIMMAFFLTMPIKQNDADDRDDVEVVAGDDQEEQRAHARRRQGGQDRHRMDEALIEHAQHDIDRDRCAAMISSTSLPSADWKATAEPWNWVVMPGGSPAPALGVLAPPPPPRPANSPAPRRRRYWRDGNWPRWSICSGTVRCSTWAMADSGTWPPLGRRQIDVVQRRDRVLQLGIGFQDDPVLVGLGEDGRDDALAETVIERIVDRRGRDAEPRRGIAVHRQIGRQALVEKVGGDIAQGAAPSAAPPAVWARNR